jgi:hypothetical protein
MVMIAGSPMLAAAEALTIVEQIEGALAYLDTVDTRAEDAAYKRMRLVLTSAHTCTAPSTAQMQVSRIAQPDARARLLLSRPHACDLPRRTSLML